MTVMTGQQETVAEPRSARAVRVGGGIGVEFAGVLTLLLGAWGALVPFIAPLFSFSADGTPSWTWTAAHTWLFLVPGVVAAVGGLLMMIGGAASAALAKLGGVLAMVAGAWFVIGPIAWPLLGQGHFFGGYASSDQFARWVGYSMGPGVLLAVLGGYVFGRTGAASASTV